MLSRRRPTGAALLAFVATLMLLMGGICAAATHFLLAGRQLASQPLDREIAFRAAEAALHDAEADLIAAIASGSARLASWPAPGTCADGAQGGICMADGDHRVWQAWLDGDVGGAAAIIGVALGTFTGAQLPVLPAAVIGATTLPRYLIEIRDDPPAAGMWPRMRIVALGMGRDTEVRVLLQTEFQP
ncbi:Type IV fimbrial biogenesis protein PilX [Cupriavidus sp. U2]|uniref:pilus assembly PilX family protein n=1 Tax=Cupriavidus sp. U2 TaxID=2920269 RepID=UPI00129D9E9A|nr:pilus assembly protein PilX [Cupriavidus sp. U2]KAI3590115.1 Type IV fimbrial biogenesis protein PilX [Cupriavidus sp. U2]